ncbi:hypothetical protein LTR37_020886 [Vermiconidia calcicola]|uniref:Uncharacterized protein n=1 Tax=Vermiconidia calcicola TaxID=1690605 RepID=A0ACC3M9Z7_9PEZI|nr:hypothetical protein LTR37_020886 [Vermiconidia calcicola]
MKTTIPAKFTSLITELSFLAMASGPHRGQIWDAVVLLGMRNPDKPHVALTCVGYAPSQHRRCRKEISQHNIAAAKTILNDLPGVKDTGDELVRMLQELAGLTLCRRFHRYQEVEVTAGWHQIILDELDDRYQSDTDTASDTSNDLWEEVRRLQRELDEIRRQAKFSRQRSTTSKGAASSHNGPREGDTTKTSASSAKPRTAQDTRERKEAENEARRWEEVRREEARLQAERERAAKEAEAQRQEEARRQAERERAEREAEAQRKAERERLKREKEKAASSQREQQDSERMERERRDWDSSWKRYNRDWEKMARLRTSTLLEDVKDSVPWPVKDGVWQDVSERNVEEFFRNAPDGASKIPIKVRSLLRRQALSWHEDKIRQFYPRIAGDVETFGLAQLVMQVINRMSERL